MSTTKNRKFVSNDLVINDWKDISGYFSDLTERPVSGTSDLLQWWRDLSELESVLEEELAWRYIKMNCNTANEELSNHFNHFVTEIEPEISKSSNMLEKKLVELEARFKLSEGKFQIAIRSIKNSIDLFREENIPIIAELQKEEQEYGVISSKMSITYKGEEMTLHKAANLLKETERTVREEAYFLINKRREADREKLHLLLDKLIARREIIAKNAGFDNYRDYKFRELGRFDYTLEHCEQFHKAIASNVRPLVTKINEHRKEKLGFALRPWDLEVDIDGKSPLKPFADTAELVKKTIQCFSEINPEFGEFISIMNSGGFLDLEARKNKAPGGFNYPLYESNIPFIYMNATGNHRDMVTMMHEGGHAVHSFLCKDHELVNFKSTPSEVAELASMTMELISMDYWGLFFKDPDELKRARRIQLEGVISVLPWVAVIDKFQNWLYLNPGHSHDEREDAWIKIFNEFNDQTIDWSGLVNFKRIMWQKQLHIYEVPFYYIEYAMAQLGAIAIWRNFRNDSKKAVKQYEAALKLGYTATIPEIYTAAGIRFDFSEKYISELMDFVLTELNKNY